VTKNTILTSLFNPVIKYTPVQKFKFPGAVVKDMCVYVSQSVSSFIYKSQTKKRSPSSLIPIYFEYLPKKSIENSIVVKYRGRRNHPLNQEDMLDELHRGFDLILSSRFSFIVPAF